MLGEEWDYILNLPQIGPPTQEYSIFLLNIFESQFFKTETNNRKSNIISNIYQPNKDTYLALKALILSELISKIRQDRVLFKVDLILLGDMNINLINFDLMKIQLNT